MGGNESQPLDIAIIGGGIAGLTLAIGLLKHNINVTIYEAAHQFGEIGAGVAFGTNALRAMGLIDQRVVQGFENCATSNLWPSKSDLWFEIRFGQDHDAEHRSGQLLCQLLCPGGQATAHRAHFLTELVKLIPSGISHFGKRVTKLEDLGSGAGVHLTFRDGTEAIHAAVIGCDGIRSETRKFILGPSDVSSHASYSGKYCHRGLVSMDKAIEVIGDELAQNNQVYLGHHGHVLTFPIDKGKTLNVVAFSSQKTWTSKDWVISSSKEELLADFAGWGDTVQKILNLVENMDIWAQFDDFDAPAETYYKGPVCIVGDAAHASTSHQGSGAGMAIEDAFVLSNLIAHVTEQGQIEAAFKAYDTVRRERTQRLVASSREAGRLWGFELDGVGDDIVKLRQNILTRMQWIWEEDLAAEVEKGKLLLLG